MPRARRAAVPGRRKGEAALDRWTWVHLASGLALGALPLLWPLAWWMALGLLVLYELFEGGLRRIQLKDGGLFEYESWPNILADVGAGMLGFALMQAALRTAGAL